MAGTRRRPAGEMAVSRLFAVVGVALAALALAVTAAAFTGTAAAALRRPADPLHR